MKPASTMLPSRTCAMSINHNWQALYEWIWRPQFFARWASGLAAGNLRLVDNAWLADGPEGPVRIRFTSHNTRAIMDHYIDTGSGTEVHIPMRIVANGQGSEVLLTLFRQPEMDDAKFEADTQWVMRNLRSLKAIIEA